MAISLTMENFSYAEPMKKNRFLVQFQGKGGLETADTNGLTIACHACGTPKLTISQQELHRFNDRVYVPGKGEFNEIDFEFYEFVKTTNSGNALSAGDSLWKWQNKVYNPSTGVVGYKEDISTGVLIVQFDGAGNVVRTWNLYHAWPTGVEFDGLDSKADDIQNVKVTLRYDWASQNNTDGSPNTSKAANQA